MADTWREIRLRDGRIVLVDADIFGWASQRRWFANKTNHVNCNARVDGRPTTRLLHRLIIDAPQGLEVDHINGDPLDNRRANLRLVTHAQNLQNRRGAKRCSATGVRGVHIYRGRFIVQVAVNGKRRHIGSFGTLTEADRAAQEARRRYMTHARECSAEVSNA